jgi:hypothetical protein
MTTFYQKLILEIEPTLTTSEARGVEAHMRSEYGTLNHLPRETFKSEIKMFQACEAMQPGYGEALANSYGL